MFNKIFIACPISKYLTEDGIDNDFEEFIKETYIFCKKYKKNVILALDREEYGKKKMYGDECTTLDYKEMLDTDLLIAFPEDSAGVAVELGWASAMKKTVLVFIDKKYHQSELVKSINSVTNGEKIEIDTINGYKSQINIIKTAISKYLVK